ncbi:MAG: two-CW domain-containing protein [bacterium]
MVKRNCWEFKGCGRGPGGKNVGELGVCPAATYKKLNSIHGGKNAGRVCWLVVGTMCGGEIQGTFAKKYKDCMDCDFYRFVEREEGELFIITIEYIKVIPSPLR